MCHRDGDTPRDTPVLGPVAALGDERAPWVGMSSSPLRSLSARSVHQSFWGVSAAMHK